MPSHFAQYPNERRRSPRVNGAGIKVEYYIDGNRPLTTTALVKGICIHGICIYMPNIIEMSQMISMNIFLAGGQTPLHAQGVVVWYSAGNRKGYYTVGIEFEKMPEEDREKLSVYITANLKSL